MSKEAQPLANHPALPDEELRTHTIGAPEPLTSGILLVDYDPRWPELFRREADRIREVVGRRALQIEHVGSTSVPGLIAKPIIDMLLMVSDSADEKMYATDLQANRYLLRIREPNWYEHRMFTGPDTKINLHVLSFGCVEIERMVIFRDRLRSHAADRDLYARTKLALARQNWKYVQNYADAKSIVVEQIIARARLELD
jgi:GrpB-like predicted nucleotidyltransferase (UPF0157 family)